MKKGTVFFHPIEGSGALTISWTAQPKGDAVEASKGCGVGFFSDSGELLCVIFDEVQADQDRQFLEFKQYRVEIVVQNSKVKHSLVNIKTKPSLRNKQLKRRRLVK